MSSREQTRSLITFRILPILCALGMGLMACTAMSQGCDEGIVRLPSGVNGKVTICPAIAAQVPLLERQMNEIAKAQTAQQGSSRELTRLLRNLNGVSHNLGEHRQVELLQNFAAQLTAHQAAGAAETQRQITSLADSLETLKDLLLDKLSNPSTARNAADAVNGPVGDAIARLDVPKADALLEGIRVQLNAIGSEVGAVHAQTTEMNQTLQQERAEAEQRRKDDRRAADEAEAARETDPNTFAFLSLQAIPSELFLFAGHPGAGPFSTAAVVPFSDPTMRVVFRDKAGTNPRLLTVIDRQLTMPESWRHPGVDYGDSATVCFAARDPIKKTMRRQVTQHFRVLVSPRGDRVSFLPQGDPVLSPADEKLCDGVSDKYAILDPPAPAPAPPAAVTPAPRPAALPRPEAMPGPPPMPEPGRFLVYSINGWRRPTADPQWMLVSKGLSFVGNLSETRMDLVFFNRGTRNAVQIVIPKFISGTFAGTQTMVRAIGERAVICFSAKPSAAYPRLRWRQEYEVLDDQRTKDLHLNPSAPTTLLVDDGTPCH